MKIDIGEREGGEIVKPFKRSFAKPISDFRSPNSQELRVNVRWEK